MSVPAVLVVPQSAYLLVFGMTALGCFLAARRARRIDEGEVRVGLVSLLSISGLWSAFHFGRLAAPTVPLKTAFYLLGLIVGLGSVGAWLYFCSAYTGQDYHRRRGVRRAAVGVYLFVVTIKLTNPLHGQYFTTHVATDPFARLVIVQGALHWVVTTLAYALSAVGFFLLYELFADSNQDTSLLAWLVSLTALPVVLDVAGYTTEVLVELNYEPIGVALFAVGVLYATEEKFLSVPKFGRQQVVERLGNPVVLLDAEDLVRDYNGAAEDLFPAMGEAEGRPIDEVLPSVAEKARTDGGLLRVEDEETTRFFLVRATPLTVGETDIGRGLVFNDVTDIENHRLELERQNEQLEGFAEAINHELRNALNIVTGYLELAGQSLDDGDADRAENALTKADDSAERMTRIVNDLSALALYGQTVEELVTCDFEDVVRVAWADAETSGMSLTVSGTGTVRADPDRLGELLSTAFAFARANGADRVRVVLRRDGFDVTGDGEPVGVEDPERLFAYGEAVPDAESGMLLPTVRMLARVHGWTSRLDPDFPDGVRLQVDDVEVTLRN